MLELRDLTYEINGNALVDAASLDVEPGTMVAIVGPNGAGKSTLLRLAAGELDPTRGTATLDGRDVHATPPAVLATRRAVVSQFSELTFPFTVEEVVCLGLSVPGFADPARMAARHVVAALEAADLVHLSQRSYLNLSGGERQRTHFARALCQLAAAPPVAGTRLLMLDEPTANLDLAHQLMIFDQARRVAASGIAVLAVLHDLNLAATFSDKMVLMSGGRIAAAGPPAKVMADEILSTVFRCMIRVGRSDPANVPFVLPQNCRLEPAGPSEALSREMEPTS